jgi:O-antigen ligase
MLTALVIFCSLLWLPIFLYQVAQRGFSILLLWLLIAPVASNLVNELSTDPVSPAGTEQGSLWRPGENPYLVHRTTLELREFLEPTRIIFLIFMVVFLLDTLLRRKHVLAFDRQEIWMGIFSVILVSSVLLQSNRIAYGLRIATDAFLIPFVGYYIARRLVINEDRFHQFLRVLGYLGCYLICMSLTELLMQPFLQHRVKGPFRHRDLLYIVIMVAFFMVLLDFLRNRGLSRVKHALPHSVQWCVLGLAPLVIFLTLTRGNWLGFALGLWVFLFLARRLLGFHQKLVMIGLFLLLVPLAVLGIWAAIPEEVVQRASEGNTIRSRFLSWQMALEEGLRRPIFGIGLNNLRDILGTIILRVSGVRNLTSLHNCFLAIFVELGVVGLFSYLAVIVSIVQMGLSLYRKRMQARAQWCGVIVIAMMVAHFVPAFFSTILYVPAVSHVYLFVSLGAIAGVYHSHQPVLSWDSCHQPCLQRVPTVY